MVSRSPPMTVVAHRSGKRSAEYHTLTIRSVESRTLATQLALLAEVMGFSDFPGKQFVKSVINTGMGFPSVVVGLLVLFTVSNQGPLGDLELIFTKEAMIMSQFVQATPPNTTTASRLSSRRRQVRDAAHVLGEHASTWR